MKKGGFGRFIGRILSFLGEIPGKILGAHSAATTFYMFLSLPSIVILVCSLIPQTSLTQEYLIETVSSYLPEEVMSIVEILADGVYSGATVAFSISLLLTFWSAGLGVASLMRGLRAAYGSEKNVSFIMLRLRAIVYMIIFMAALAVALVLVVFGQTLSEFIAGLLPDEGLDWLRTLITDFGRNALSFAMLFFAFLLIYRFGSGSGIKLHGHIIGAAVASIGWIGIAWLFSTVTSITAKYTVYGVLGTYIAAMLWLYYCIYLLLIGGCLNSFIYRRRHAG